MNETEHLLVILGEEAAEVAHRVSKALRFGLGDIDPQRHETARRILERELGDLVAVAEILGLEIRDEDKASKREKLKKYMAYSREVGALEKQKAEAAAVCGKDLKYERCQLREGHAPPCSAFSEKPKCGGYLPGSTVPMRCIKEAGHPEACEHFPENPLGASPTGRPCCVEAYARGYAVGEQHGRVSVGEKPRHDTGLCVCGHDFDQHVKSGPRKGECLASNSMGAPTCKCTEPRGVEKRLIPVPVIGRCPGCDSTIHPGDCETR